MQFGDLAGGEAVQGQVTLRGGGMFGAAALQGEDHLRGTVIHRDFQAGFSLRKFVDVAHPVQQSLAEQDFIHLHLHFGSGEGDFNRIFLVVLALPFGNRLLDEVIDRCRGKSGFALAAHQAGHIHQRADHGERVLRVEVNHVEVFAGLLGDGAIHAFEHQFEKAQGAVEGRFEIVRLFGDEGGKVNFFGDLKLSGHGKSASRGEGLVASSS